MDVYFDQKSNVLSRLIVNGVDEHPFLAKGPVNFKEITSYTNYKKKGEFLLPEMIDEIDTRNEFTLRKQLNWVNLNDLFAASTFNPEPVFEDRTKFIISEMGNGLYVLERSGGSVNERFLIRLDRSGMVEIFSALIINDGLNKAELDAVKSKFLGYDIENVFNIGKIWSIESLSGFYSNKTMIYAPKEVGMFAEEKLPADSEEVLKRNEVRKLGLLMTFDKEFQTESVETLILNPVRNDDFESIYVDYYLPKERTIFLYGNPYSADSSTKSATPREKILYDLIKKRSLKVDQLVYSGAYLNNAPLFMTFKDFETRIKNTDFFDL
ncbi:hypothetical protein Dfri01_03980 [Dyadobacter frigoris]|uniref:hypothetical protein n=1 Tax=Dyadobacter frigoris TaxID=2576211 RepID=UPI0024A44D80|nr:hypothetical protein [Dyadobacter frigoris]GLU50937.1 hypothetical protein Dfri01_03980 [Dyadobacter frigoris]